MIRRWWWVLLVMGLVGPVVGLFGAAVITYVMPTVYESSAVVQVMPGSGPAHSMPSQFLATEMEVITASKTLERAADRLDLPVRWAVPSDQAIEMLRGTVEVEPIRGTDLLRIEVRHTIAEDARDIAMEVAAAYRDRKAELEQARASQDHPVQANLPRTPVVIHEQAVLARAPVSPNVSLNLALGLVAGIPLGLLLGLLMMLLLDRSARKN